MSGKKSGVVFVQGPITPGLIATSIAKHQTKTSIGAHDIFLGQVRADGQGDKRVQAIEYSAYATMAEKKISELRESAFEKFDLSCLHIYHSLGLVRAGEIGFFVFASSKHRRAAMDASRYLVEQIKKELPIFAKELLNDESHTWKTNTLSQ